MAEEITEAIRNAFNEYLNAVDKIILENQALQIELQRLKQENEELGKIVDSKNGTIATLAMINADKGSNIKQYRSALEEIRAKFLNQVAWVGQLTSFEEEIYNKINEVLNDTKTN